MTEMPKEIWAADVQYEGARRRTWRRTPGPGQSTGYVRADIADEHKRQRDRVVEAAEALQRLSEAEWISINGIDIGYEEPESAPFRNLFAAIAKAEGDAK